LGSSFSVLALPLLVLALTGSPAQAGLLLALRQLPFLLLTLPAGVLVDRWDRKTLLRICELVRWLTMGVVPLAFVLGRLTLPLLAVVTLVEGCLAVFYSVAQISTLPRVVQPEQLAQACALDTSTEYVGSLLGPSLGALIIGLAASVTGGAMLAYLADSLSFLVSLLSLLGIRVSFQVPQDIPQEAQGGLLRELFTGLRLIWRERLIRALALLTAVVNFLQSPLDLVLLVLGKNVLHLSVPVIGLLIACGGIGGLAGSVIAPWLCKRWRIGKIVLVSTLIWGCALLAMACLPWPPVLIVGRFLISFIWPAYAVVVVSTRLERTPDVMHGRVNSAFRCLTYGSEPLGAAFGGLLLGLLSPQMTLGILAACSLICLLVVNGPCVVPKDPQHNQP
jgi:MFS family permease